MPQEQTASFQQSIVYTKGSVSTLTVPLGDEEIAQYKGKDSKYAQRGGFVTQPLATSSKDPRPNLRYAINVDGCEIWPEKQWIWEKTRVEAAIANDEVVVNDGSGKVSVRVKQYLRDETGRMREMKPLSLLIGPFNQEGSREIEEMLGDGVFSFPKPVALVRHFLSLTINEVLKKDDLVLDFFAGSGTTGHAVMMQNAADGGNRRYILVQLPEPLDASNSSQKTAAEFCVKLKKPLTIAEITKERLRRAGKNVKADTPLFAGDVGFRVYKLDSSNIRPWNPTPTDLPGAIQFHTDNILEGRTEADILTELLLKLGLDLCVPIEPTTVAGKTVHSVGGVLFVCLSDRITAAEAVPLAKGIADLHKASGGVGESMVVFRDSAFDGGDVVKTNLTENLRQLGLTNVRSL